MLETAVHDLNKFVFPPLEVFPNDVSDRYTVRMTLCLRVICPITHKQDVGKLYIRYVPGHKCLEAFSLASLVAVLKDVEAYHEMVVDFLFKKIGTALNPLWLEVEAVFPLYSKLAGDPMEITVTKASNG